MGNETKPQQSNPRMFLGGVPRSGTTLLQRMLDAHPELCVINDSHFIPRALKKTDKSLVLSGLNGQPIPLSKQLLDNVWNYHRFYRTGIEQHEFESAAQLGDSYQTLVENLFNKVAEKAGKKFAGEKTPDYCRHFELLNKLFPKSCLILIVRDGRDVALSLKDWSAAKKIKGPAKLDLWETNPVATCALWWRWMVLESLSQLDGLDCGIQETVLYEDLIADPQSELQKLCGLLQMEFSEEMLAFNRGKVNANNGQSAKSAWLGPQKGLRDWRRDMPQNDVALFEYLAGDALDAAGYQRSVSRFEPSTEEIAAAALKWWQANFHHQDKTSGIKQG